MASHDEVVTLVDTEDKVIGSKQFSELNKDDRWRIIAVWITDDDGRVLIAQRSHQKQLEPNKWGPAVAGTVTHPDGYQVSARRELFEELGIESDKLEHVDNLVFDAAFGKRVCAVFKLQVKDDTKFTPQEDEVAQIKWVGLDELAKSIASNPLDYTRNLTDLVDYFIHK
jgi:isopentenyl-diphosphate delta-isomerase